MVIFFLENINIVIVDTCRGVNKKCLPSILKLRIEGRHFWSLRLNDQDYNLYLKQTKTCKK